VDPLVGIGAWLRIDDCWRQGAGKGAHGRY